MAAHLIPRSGDPARLGATITPEGVNFAVYSETAASISVCLFDKDDRETARFELDGREGAVFHGLIGGIGEGTKYGLRADGPYEPRRALHFDPAKLLVDPYARRIDRRFVRSDRLRLPREADEDTSPLVPKGIVSAPLEKPTTPRRKGQNLIYEINPRGYTIQHPDVAAAQRGTLAGLGNHAVIAHLNHIGVDVAELMPIQAFIDDAHLPKLGLANAWGYNPVTFFALDPRLAPRGLPDLRHLTDVYRKHALSVVLDVVFNHSGEGDAEGPILSLMGLDAATYYRHVEVDGELKLVNDAGTGNILRCDHPAVQDLILDSLRMLVEEGGVSGFRFDLATVLGREPGFNPNAVLLQRIKSDPVLSKCLLIAEPWDVGPGGYQLGQFGREFREWNDTFRDDIRSFWRGDDGKLGALAGKLAGSAEIFDFGGRKPSNGVNFIATHDGFTLADLVSFADKHNEANGENNRDGHGHNFSWNGGVEGATSDPRISAGRKRDARALLATLMLARGTPMIQQGDEMGRSQGGNNNAYAQDNPTTWVDWSRADRPLVDYVAALSAFRRAHPAVATDQFLSGQPGKSGVRDVVWLHPDGREMTEGDWNYRHASVLGVWLGVPEDTVLIWFNRSMEAVQAQLPSARWTVALVSDDTAMAVLADQRLLLPPRSVVALVPGTASAH